MMLTNLKFASLLSYVPKNRWNYYGDSSDMTDRLHLAYAYMTALKQHQICSDSQIPLVAQVSKECAKIRDFEYFFNNRNSVLIPVPNSKITDLNSLWVPHILADALIKEGLGGRVETCVRRVHSIRKASLSGPGQRPTIHDHDQTTEIITQSIIEPSQILLVDDVVTRGTAFLSTYYKVRRTWPNANIMAFAAMRTVLPCPDSFRMVMDPYIGNIRFDNESIIRSGNRI